MFSPSEQKILKILGRKKMTVTQITVELYRDRPQIHGNIVVNNCVNRIIKKCTVKKLDWTLETEGCGRNGKSVKKVRI